MWDHTEIMIGALEYCRALRGSVPAESKDLAQSNQTIAQLDAAYCSA